MNIGVFRANAGFSISKKLSSNEQPQMNRDKLKMAITTVKQEKIQDRKESLVTFGLIGLYFAF